MVSRLRKVRHEGFARCEVVASHLAKFGNRRVQCLGVAPCDLFLIVLRKSGGRGEVDAKPARNKQVCQFFVGLWLLVESRVLLHITPPYNKMPAETIGRSLSGGVTGRYCTKYFFRAQLGAAESES